MRLFRIYLPRSLLLLALFLSSLGLAPPQTTGAQERSRVFPETGHTVRGRFLQYWEDHGGLAQQGFPISDEQMEVSDTDGKPYLMQYFQRAVFELHPENPAPYDVLLTLLGTFAYAQRYGIAGAFAGQVNPTNPHRFAETGHSIGGMFRSYWEAHGGLAQQGVPLSDELSEISSLDGRTYTVQYFERAVFEWHPENAGTPYEVLLSQLGALRQQAQAPDAALPAPGPNRRQYRPLGSAQYLVWSEQNLPPAAGGGRDSVEFRARNLATGHLQLVGDAPGPVDEAALDGSLLVWLHGGAACPPDCQNYVVGRDLATGRHLNIALTPERRRGLVAGGGKIGWQEGDRLVAYDVASGRSETLTQLDSVLGNRYLGAYALTAGYAVWSEIVYSGDPNVEYWLQARNFATGQSQTLRHGYSSSKDQPVEISADGTAVVWTDPALHYLDLVSGATRDLAPDYATHPSLHAGTVIWSGKAGANSTDLDLICMTLADSTPHLLATGLGNQTAATVAGPWLVWQNNGGATDHLLGRSTLTTAFAQGAVWTAPPAGQPLNTHLASGPRVGGTWVFGTEQANISGAINTILYGYNTANGEWRQITNYLDSQRNRYFSDGQQVAWIEGTTSSIAVNDLATGVISRVVQLDDPANSYLNLYGLDNGILYYTRGDRVGNHFLARTLANGQETQITDHRVDQALVGDGQVVWSEMVTAPSKGINPVYATHLYRSNGSSNDVVLPIGSDFYNTIQIAGDHIVWTTAFTGALRLYTISSGTTSTLVDQGATEPQIRGNLVVWLEVPTTATFGWTIRSRDLVSGATALIVGGIWPQVDSWGITANRRIVYTITGGPNAGLYLAPLP